MRAYVMRYNGFVHRHHLLFLALLKGKGPQDGFTLWFLGFGQPEKGRSSFGGSEDLGKDRHVWGVTVFFFVSAYAHWDAGLANNRCAYMAKTRFSIRKKRTVWGVLFPFSAPFRCLIAWSMSRGLRAGVLILTFCRFRCAFSAWFDRIAVNMRTGFGLLSYSVRIGRFVVVWL